MNLVSRYGYCPKTTFSEILISFVRQSNFNKALLTPKWDEADVLSKQQEDSLIARMKMFVHLRQDLERVCNLGFQDIRS